MKNTHVKLFVTAAILLQAALAHAVDCTFEKMVVDSQNSSALARYNDAWKKFDAEFAKEKPVIQARAAELYPKWKAMALKTPDLFNSAMKQLKTDDDTPVPVNDLTRVVESGLEKSFPRQGISLKPLVKTILNPDGSTAGKTFNVDQYGEPKFELCFDDWKFNPSIRLSVMCGDVTRMFVPDQQTFVDDYVAQVRSSQAINGSADLQKPYMAKVAAECVPGYKPPATDADADQKATGDGNADGAQAPNGDSTQRGAN